MDIIEKQLGRAFLELFESRVYEGTHELMRIQMMQQLNCFLTQEDMKNVFVCALEHGLLEWDLEVINGFFENSKWEPVSLHLKQTSDDAFDNAMVDFCEEVGKKPLVFTARTLLSDVETLRRLEHQSGISVSDLKVLQASDGKPLPASPADDQLLYNLSRNQILALIDALVDREKGSQNYRLVTESVLDHKRMRLVREAFVLIDFSFRTLPHYVVQYKEGPKDKQIHPSSIDLDPSDGTLEIEHELVKMTLKPEKMYVGYVSMDVTFIEGDKLLRCPIHPGFELQYKQLQEHASAYHQLCR